MNIGLLGFGVVGGGVWELAAERDDICVKRVLLRSPKAGLPESAVTFDVNDILNDDAIDTVVEVMGGLHPAYEYVTAAMERGKNLRRGGSRPPPKGRRSARRAAGSCWRGSGFRAAGCPAPRGRQRPG